MAKHTKNVPAITEAALQAAKSLTAWDAVKAHGKRIHEASRDATVTGDFAELHFSGARVQGVVKVGNVVMKIEA